MAHKLNKDKTKIGYYSHSVASAVDATIKTDAVASDTDTAITTTTEVATGITTDATEKDYCTVVKKVKKDNITPENIGEIMLCQIPGISSTSALAILAEFKTLPNLIKRVNEEPNCLSNICTVDANGKSRKISKTSIATIVRYFTYTKSNTTILLQTVATFS
jgi:ERCC4-type nuclease